MGDQPGFFLESFWHPCRDEHKVSSFIPLGETMERDKIERTMGIAAEGEGKHPV
jgi:hypothetical protein